MKKLTENLIQQRLKSCTTDLDKVIQINVTGRELEDVSLLQKMTGVEILSFSVNQISSLADFRFCKNLKELYLRNNKITDVKQISYLKNLPKLKLLTLSENPCTQDPLYRMTVIKNLKNLVELDGISIKAEERRLAQKLGKEILSEDEEPIEYSNEGLQNYSSPTQNMQKLKTSQENMIEPNDTKESKDSKESREPKIIYKVMAENDSKESNATENTEQNFKPSSSSENNVRNETELLSKSKMKPKLQYAPFTCKFCGSQESPKNKCIPKHYNVLSAALNLVKELDYSCLQVVYAEVSSCLNAYEIDLL